VQSVVVPVMASSAATAICHVAVCWALVFKAGMGSRGAAGAEHCHLVLHVCINLAMLALYVRLPAAGRHGRGSPWMRSGSSGDSPSLPYHRP
jgi:MATE family multidrug resistance protein